MCIAVRICTLHMDNRHIRVQRWDNDDILSAVWIGNSLDIWVCLFEVCCTRLIHWQKGQSGRTRLQTCDHAEVRILLPFEFALLQRRPDDAQRANAWVSHVRKDHFASTACRHQHIVNKIRCGACQDQILFALTNDLVPRRKGNEMGKARRVNCITIVHKFRNGFRERYKLAHYFFALSSFGLGISFLIMLNRPLGFIAFLYCARNMSPMINRIVPEQNKLNVGACAASVITKNTSKAMPTIRKNVPTRWVSSLGSYPCGAPISPRFSGRKKCSAEGIKDRAIRQGDAHLGAYRIHELVLVFAQSFKIWNQRGP